MTEHIFSVDLPGTLTRLYHCHDHHCPHGHHDHHEHHDHHDHHDHLDHHDPHDHDEHHYDNDDDDIDHADGDKNLCKNNQKIKNVLPNVKIVKQSEKKTN